MKIKYPTVYGQVKTEWKFRLGCGYTGDTVLFLLLIVPKQLMKRCKLIKWEL
jgi:hypothetical protein